MTTVRLLPVLAVAGCTLAIGFENPQDLRLTNLAISQGMLVPTFSPDVTSYTVSLPPTASLGVLAAAEDEDAQITIDNQQVASGVETTIATRPGTRRINTVVRSPTGVSNTYAITATIAGTDFEPAITANVNSIPASLVAGDFDEDGHRDLAIAAGGGIAILLGRGDGTFAISDDINAVGSNLSIVTGDLDEDQHADLAFVSGQQGVCVMRGRGDGTFDPAVTQQGIGTEIAIGELTGDSHLDLATIAVNEVKVFRGNGTTSVTEIASVVAGTSPRSLVIGDVFDEGPELGEPNDLIAVLPEEDAFVVLDNDGTGTAFARSPVPIVGSPHAIGLIDLNDAPPDIALSFGSSQRVGFHFNVFSPGLDFSVDLGHAARQVVVRQLDDDGKPDLVVTTDDENVVVLFSLDDGFVPIAFPVTVAPDFARAVVLDDFNGDGVLDIATANASPTVSVLLGVKP